MFQRLALVSLLLATACEGDFVYLTNNTQDNIEPDCDGHLGVGENAVVAALDGKITSADVAICRSYGRLAEIHIIQLLPSKDGSASIYIELTEPVRDTFEITTGSPLVSVTIDNLTVE